jgi:hypothetical protein
MTLEVLVVIVVISALATFSIWRWAAHKPSLPKRKFYRELTFGKPIVPKHERPKNIGDEWPNLADDEDRKFLATF